MARPQKKPSPATHGVEPTAEWENLVESATETRRRLGRFYTRVEGRALQDPVRAMGWAVAAGFVLGGGVFSRLTFRVARVAATMALRAGGAAFVARGFFEMAPLIERLQGETHRWTSAS